MKVARVALLLVSGLIVVALSATAQAATAARLVGPYAVTVSSVTVGGHSDPDIEPTSGNSLPLKWRFAPKCHRGACNVDWAELGSAFSHGRVLEPPVEQARLKRTGNTYAGQYMDACGRDETPYRLTVRVTASTLRKGRRIASRFTATLIHAEAYDNGPDGEVLYQDRVIKFRGRLPRAVQPYSQYNPQCVSRSV